MARLAQGEDQRLSPDAPVSRRWKGRPVQLVAGSTVSMPDTPANQQASPQHPRQPQGLGFPIARVLGVLCLARGSWVPRAVGRSQGKETGELAR